MNAPQAPLPARLSRPERAQADLDGRIACVERRLIAREDGVRRRVALLTRRVSHAMQPRQLLTPVLGGLLGLTGLWWLLRGRSGDSGGLVARPASASDRGDPTDPARPGGGGELPWVRLLGLAWPLLPERWRNRVNPATASTVLALGLPLLERLFAGRAGARRPLATMPQVDLMRFAGSWFEVARLPALFEGGCAAQSSAHYTPQLDGRIHVLKRCPDEHGGAREVHGLAQPVPGSGGARLRLSLWPQPLQWLPMAWSDCWILHVDESYTEALVGSPGRDALWLLSRRPRLAPERVKALVQIAQDRGFAVRRLHFTEPA